MIRLFSPAPALDFDARVKGPTGGKIGCMEGFRFSAGGKAVNLARFLRAWRVPYRLDLGAGGGDHPTHVLYSSLMKEEGLRPFYVDPKAPIRVNLVLEGDGPSAKYNHPGFKLDAKNVSAYGRTLGKCRRGDLFVLAGRVAEGIGPKLLAYWVRGLEKRGVRCWVDTSGPHLTALLRARPSFLKVNLYELGEALGMKFRDLEDLPSVLPVLHRWGLTHGAVTNGVEGALGWEGPEVVRAVPPRVRKRTGLVVGAGDAFLAGYLRAWRSGLPLRERVRWACAAGAAVARDGIRGFRPAVVKSFLRQVRFAR